MAPKVSAAPVRIVVKKPPRIETRVPGLDVILQGGLFEAGVYIVEGLPGVGKTTLANQIAYLHARRGVKTLYVTMLAESHARMLQHMAGQTFFDPEAVNSEVLYLSAYSELEQQGLKSVLALLRGELATHKAGFLMIDGLLLEGRATDTGDDVRRFVHELQSLAVAMKCTCLLLTGPNARANAEHTMVDGIFELDDVAYQWRAERQFQVRKFRGSSVQRGRHTFCITDDGIQFFPRLEGLPAPEPALAAADELVSSGTEALDQALSQGALPRGSSTLFSGPTGTGKTLLALAFACRAESDQPSLFFSCMEPIDDLVRLGSQFRLPVAESVAAGALTMRWRGHEDEALDEIGHKVLRLIEEAGARRLVFDGLAGLADTVAFPERGYRFLARFLIELKARGVTSAFTLDPLTFPAVKSGNGHSGIAACFDNVIELARNEDGMRSLTIRKVRGLPTPRAVLYGNDGDASDLWVAASTVRDPAR